jgi:ribonuclease Z
MTFSLTILGCSSATPTLYRHPSAQILNVTERLFLIDCGEGAQMQMRNYSIRFQRINHIFISHLHGDHYLGLMGLLFTFHLLGRTNPVHLYAHTDLEKIIDLQLSASQAHLNFPLIFHPLTYKGQELIFEDEIMTVHSFPLQHRIPTVGFIIKEKTSGTEIQKRYSAERRYSLRID